MFLISHALRIDQVLDYLNDKNLFNEYIYPGSKANLLKWQVLPVEKASTYVIHYYIIVEIEIVPIKVKEKNDE